MFTKGIQVDLDAQKEKDYWMLFIKTSSLDEIELNAYCITVESTCCCLSATLVPQVVLDQQKL